jgi:hypothetical protein
MRAAVPNTLALDEQAVDTTCAGPARPRYRRTNPPSDHVFWVSA